MVHRQASSRRDRIAILAAVTVLHAVLLGLFLTQRSAEQTPVAPSTSIALIAVNAEKPAAAKPPPPPVLPSVIADTFKPLVEFSIPVEAESDAPAGATGACATQSAVLDALLADPEARDAIREAPPETRSISDAIVIWNEAWNPIVVDTSAPLYRVRSVVESTLVSATPACLDEPITGPRLLPIPDANGARTSFIVVGSGVWMWRELLRPSPLPAAEPAGPAPTPAPQAPPSAR